MFKVIRSGKGMKRLKGLFGKWYCPDCNSILPRRLVKYQTQSRGYYSVYWFRCLNCGKTNVITLSERLVEIITSK